MRSTSTKTVRSAPRHLSELTSFFIPLKYSPNWFQLVAESVMELFDAIKWEISDAYSQFISEPPAKVLQESIVLGLLTL